LSLFVELVDVSSVKVIWSQHYDRKQSNIISLQSEIARDLSTKLRSGLSGDDEKKVTRTGTDNPEAYRLYLLGNSLAARRKVKDIQAALQNYQQAIALDPNYAKAYTGLATAETFMAIYGDASGADELPKARAAAVKALEIDPNSAEAHNILGGVELFLGRDFAASKRETDRALEIDPNLANGHRHRGLYLAWQGHFDDAIVEFKRSLEIEPLAPATNLNLAWCLLYAGRIDESDAQLKAVQDIDPGFWFAEYQRFVNARMRGDHAGAVEHLARAQELRDMPDAAKFIRESFAKNGWEGFMRASISEPDRCKIWDYYLATFATELGEKDKAFEFLDRAYDKYDQFVLFVKIDHLIDPLRDDPRLAMLEQKLGFPQ
jgi:tetratricopeptide (TPR) repeat protein